MYSLACGLECQGHHFCWALPYWPAKNRFKLMNILEKHILQCNQSEPLATVADPELGAQQARAPPLFLLNTLKSPLNWLKNTKKTAISYFGEMYLLIYDLLKCIFKSVSWDGNIIAMFIYIINKTISILTFCLWFLFPFVKFV